MPGGVSSMRNLPVGLVSWHASKAQSGSTEDSAFKCCMKSFCLTYERVNRGIAQQSYRAFRLVLLIGGFHFAADFLPIGIAERGERREVSTRCQMHRAVDRNGLPGKIIASIAHQEHGEVRKLRHFTVASHRNRIAGFSAIGRLRREAIPCALRWKWPRCDGVQTDSVRTPFRRQRFGHDVKTGF